MSRTGKFDFISINNILLLESAFLTIAHKVAKSFSGNITTDDDASWARVQRSRQRSNVVIDYVLLIDVSASMNDVLRPQCFAGHDLRMANEEYRRWLCDVCGKYRSNMVINIIIISSLNFRSHY